MSSNFATVINISSTKTSLLCLIFIVFSSACKDRFCEVSNRQEGLILRSISIDGHCMALDTLTQFVVQSEAEWKRLVDSTCVLSDINFTTETLIGMRTTGKCDVGYARKVTRMDASKQYHYQVITTTCGQCELLEINYNLVVVPKLPADYTVTFEQLDNP